MRSLKLAATLMFIASFASLLHASFTPELDPTGAIGACGLIGGVLLVIRANKKK